MVITMADENNNSTYRPNGLYVTESTTKEEVVDYVRDCIEHPYVEQTADGETKVVWNFSSHSIDHDGLDVAGKDQDRFVIPFQVPGTWGFIVTLLPEPIKSAELLVYRQEHGEYFAFKNFHRITPQEQRDQIRADLSRRMESVCGDVLHEP